MLQSVPATPQAQAAAAWWAQQITRALDAPAGQVEAFAATLSRHIDQELVDLPPQAWDIFFPQTSVNLTLVCDHKSDPVLAAAAREVGLDLGAARWPGHLSMQLLPGQITVSTDVAQPTVPIWVAPALPTWTATLARIGVPSHDGLVLADQEHVPVHSRAYLLAGVSSVGGVRRAWIDRTAEGDFLRCQGVYSPEAAQAYGMSGFDSSTHPKVFVTPTRVEQDGATQTMHDWRVSAVGWAMGTDTGWPEVGWNATPVPART